MHFRARSHLRISLSRIQVAGTSLPRKSIRDVDILPTGIMEENDSPLTATNYYLGDGGIGPLELQLIQIHRRAKDALS
jgi:hypothetical protein